MNAKRISPWAEKEENAEKALEHSRLCDQLYSSDTNNSIKTTKEYKIDQIWEIKDKLKSKYGESHKPKLSVSNIDSYGAIQIVCSQKSNAGKIAVLDFASFKHPGGKFIEGSMAQEEALCHKSNLYNILKQFYSYFEYNKAHANNGLYQSKLLYIPNVRFFDFDDKGFNAYIDVIHCAAPNMNKRHPVKFSYFDNNRAIIERIDLMIDAADYEEVNTLILGAWGCGVFGQDPNFVSRAFYDRLLNQRTYNINNVIFAVPGNIDSGNFQAFYSALEDYNKM